MGDTPGTSFLLRFYLFIAALIIAAIVFAVATRDNNLLPETLGSLRLEKRLKDAAARELINRLHSKGVTPTTNEIGFYFGLNGEATVYVSVYPTSESAAETAITMAARIREGNPVFGQYRVLKAGDLDVHRCRGMGQDHYFFSVGKDLYWLAADSPVAEAALEEVLKYARK